ncbi:MAG: glycosyl transferase [Candidatus Kerfeldbacteria bacterium CG08_land_8_20_14_0_20_43_14]|uniref:Glycosyl transferase n=1 Tax=Candidatus Kerfeldbacteria bacterium CG08_land_8_20_14_0_20_43_14 TaxID=2014246 RepID=A0A2H0YQY6_9BACT|nr:MAG: glycosyl transferase [Candidatus Kerfeldbacteria bacterium CG08_land_8_20_14_0_20_43_14]
MISIVIPVYNEEKIISKTLTAYLNYFSKGFFEFIIVPNGCTDRTVEIVRKFQKSHSNLIIKEIKESVGKAEAVRRGLALAKGNLVAYLDADFSTSPEEFQRLLEAMHNADGVIASRLAPGAIVENRTHLRMAAGKTFAKIVKLFFWMPYHDTQCGAKIFTKTLLEKILPLSKVNNVAFDVELLLLAKSAKARIIELPSHWVDRSDSVIIGSQIRLLKTSLKMLFTLINLRLRFLPFFAPKI